jgi:CPA1 family monovalent cation:H+ antiporter
MTATLHIAAGLLAMTAAVAAMAKRLGLPLPILLVLAGIGLALVPGLPAVELAPDAVLLLFLPPILYYAAFGMSWQAFRANLRPIVLLAVGCVAATTVAVAAAAHLLLGLPWAVGFVLGAVVSPPDVVAPLAVARRLGIPRRVTAVLEGEGLVNDATALVLFSFAVAAVTTGAFSAARAAATFAAVVAGETVYGLCLGWLMLRLRHAARDPRVEVTLSLLTPYLAFWLPHQLGGSGVLATVVSGLYVGWKGVELIRSDTRLQALFFWDFVTYVIEGALFLLTGLQARVVLRGLDAADWRQLLLSAAVVCAVVIVVRFLVVLPATYLPRLLSPRLRERDPPPPWQFPFAIAFTGIRGVVSLAAALSLPVELAAGDPFPSRDLILFLTFCVILVTLVAQGLTLPAVMRRLGLVEVGREEREAQRHREAAARAETSRAALRRLEDAVRGHGVDPEAMGPLRAHYQARVDHLEARRDGGDSTRGIGGKIEKVEVELIEAERARLNELVREGVIGDDVRRRIERDLDLGEQRSRGNRTGLGPGEAD